MLGEKQILISRHKSPCTPDCPKRAYDCHVHCKDYIDFRAMCDRRIQKRMLDKEVVDAIGDAMKRNPGKRRL